MSTVRDLKSIEFAPIGNTTAYVTIQREESHGLTGTHVTYHVFRDANAEVDRVTDFEARKIPNLDTARGVANRAWVRGAYALGVANPARHQPF